MKYLSEEAIASYIRGRLTHVPDDQILDHLLAFCEGTAVLRNKALSSGEIEYGPAPGTQSIIDRVNELTCITQTGNEEVARDIASRNVYLDTFLIEARRRGVDWALIVSLMCTFGDRDPQGLCSMFEHF